MAHYTGPKNKLARKVGEDLGLKTNAMKVSRRINIRPGQHGAKGRRKVSDFGVQLREKQKVKIMYGIVEKQLRGLYETASKNPTATGAALLSLLERRLDNVVYRLGFAPTRAMARQMVSHGHVMIDGKEVSIPSYRIQVGEVIGLKTKATKIPVIEALLKEESGSIPAWLERKASVGTVKKLPERQDIKEPIQEQLIVEGYSR